MIKREKRKTGYWIISSFTKKEGVVMDNPHNKFPGGASGHKRVSKSGEIGSKLFGERSGIGKQFSGKKRISKSDEMLERIPHPDKYMDVKVGGSDIRL